VVRYGVLRAYATRHGAGPFVTEDAAMTAHLPDHHNGHGPWQGDFRVGHLDMVAHRYALTVCGRTDALVVTGIDRLASQADWLVCGRYRLTDLTADAKDYFVFDAAGLVRDIRLGPAGDLAYQSRLTQLLQSCEPVYCPIKGSVTSGNDSKVNDLLQVIEQDLSLPISVASFGPTAADKRALVAQSC
jgi:adenylosuccinate synthase